MWTHISWIKSDKPHAICKMKDNKHGRMTEACSASGQYGGQGCTFYFINTVQILASALFVQDGSSHAWNSLLSRLHSGRRQTHFIHLHVSIIKTKCNINTCQLDSACEMDMWATFSSLCQHSSAHNLLMLLAQICGLKKHFWCALPPSGLKPVGQKSCKINKTCGPLMSSCLSLYPYVGLTRSLMLPSTAVVRTPVKKATRFRPASIQIKT